MLILAVVAAGAVVADPPRPTDSKLQYARDIQPVLAAHCFTCHGPDAKTRKAGLRLDVAEIATRKLRSGKKAVVSGRPDKSELVSRVFATDEDRMPPASSHKPLKESDKELLKRWIAEGAEYQRHWAFVAPKRPEVPPVKTPGWVRNPIDAFVLARLEQARLKPSPEADRYTLARRVALDLTGLPPTPEAADRFVSDAAPDAYERYVDQVLSSPAYGEHWAAVWLDLARYADSNGYANDNPRVIWKYRDWVIDALNANMPFDRFTIEQLAGDMLPNATPEQILATAFHRNTLTNDEGGTSDEEFRVAAVVDRVNTTMQVWMGLTMACAQCHDHKYDPISQEEYFRTYAILNQTEDADRADDSPRLSHASAEQLAHKERLDNEIAGLSAKVNRTTPELEEAQRRWESESKPEKLPGNVQAILNVPADKRGDAQRRELAKYYRSVAPELKQDRDRLVAARKELSGINILSTPIMRELPDGKKRITRIHLRGNFLNEGKQVAPAVPEVFTALPEGQPPDRLTFARWLVDPANPLTARVTVNRYWEHLFGVGLVETPEDFGVRGKLPHHPELLDWLASEFVARKWDVKQLLRLIVTSATYRQSSAVTSALLERDPENLLLARGPRFRSPAEVVRDQALAVSGLLSTKMHGPPVRPPQPKLGLTAAFGSNTDWKASEGADRHRRGLYTQWRRTTPYPSMITFDAPSRNVCTVRRPRTNTPLQALVTLNDPVYVEAAQALARRTAKVGGATVEARARHAFRMCLTRPPRDAEVRRLVDLYEKARADYSTKREEAVQMATEPLGPLPAGMDPVDLAAWTVVGNVLLNLDEMLAKR
jgi:mono/diheme cytochrome c family protein